MPALFANMDECYKRITPSPFTRIMELNLQQRWEVVMPYLKASCYWQPSVLRTLIPKFANILRLAMSSICLSWPLAELPINA